MNSKPSRNDFDPARYGLIPTPGSKSDGKGLFTLNPSKTRRYIQLALVAIFIYAGWEFYRYYLWAVGSSPDFYPRPPASEAFLPISALVGLKRWWLGNGFDPVHPAGLTIFIAAIIIALVARKSFCGYLCPVGWFCGLIDRLGARLLNPLGISRRPGKIIYRIISLPKYLLLGLLAWAILVGMGPADVEAFLFSPYNKICDSKMLLFFIEPSTNTLIGLGVLLLGSFLVQGFWCRGFCPYGALLGIFAWFSPLAVWRDKQNCTYCRRCVRACPTGIAVHEAHRVSSPECQGCLECVAACPEPDCLSVRAGYGQKAVRVSNRLIPLLCLALLFLFIAGAKVTDNWQSKVSPIELKMYHQAIYSLGHP
ncbi:MAG: 4Fe-4S binding protein [Deltaproteobacteria bacterium]|jgi:NAD-dependent dihydropyrimidine dehydrogenase PreA subunit|nr:4Fe-4S binding protein [Deltaproteobacteria bacterium]